MTDHRQVTVTLTEGEAIALLDPEYDPNLEDLRSADAKLRTALQEDEGEGYHNDEETWLASRFGCDVNGDRLGTAEKPAHPHDQETPQVSSGDGESIQRWTMQLVDHRKEHTGEAWSEIHERPHPDGDWVRYSDLAASRPSTLTDEEREPKLSTQRESVRAQRAWRRS